MKVTESKTTNATGHKAVFTGKIEGKTVSVQHVLRRRYVVFINGNEAGYITSKDPMNAAGRVATVDKLADLKARLH